MHAGLKQPPCMRGWSNLHAGLAEEHVWAGQEQPLSFPAGVPKETFPDERRVSVTPDGVKLLLKEGFKEVGVDTTIGWWHACMHACLSAT